MYGFVKLAVLLLALLFLMHTSTTQIVMITTATNMTRLIPIMIYRISTDKAESEYQLHLSDCS